MAAKIYSGFCKASICSFDFQHKIKFADTFTAALKTGLFREVDNPYKASNIVSVWDFMEYQRKFPDVSFLYNFSLKNVEARNKEIHKS